MCPFALFSLFSQQGPLVLVLVVVFWPLLSILNLVSLPPICVIEAGRNRSTTTNPRLKRYDRAVKCFNSC